MGEFDHEVVFLSYMWAMAQLGFSFEGFILVGRCLIAIAFCVFSASVISRPVLVVLASITFVLSPFLESYSYIILRQGLSLAALLFAYMFLLKGRTYSAGLSMFLAIGAHWSAALFLFCLFLSRLKYARSMRALFIVGTCASILYIFNISLASMPLNLSSDAAPMLKYQSYTSEYSGLYDTGFKPGFFLVAMLQLMLSFILLSTSTTDFRLVRELSRFVIFIVALFMLLNGMAFYDRIAIHAWTLAPLQAAGLLELLVFRSQGPLLASRSTAPIR
jgi:hypothetical protein